MKKLQLLMLGLAIVSFESSTQYLNASSQVDNGIDNKEDPNVRPQRGFVNVGDVRVGVGPNGPKSKNKNKNKGGENTNVPRDFKDE